jgi:hypothetical protein
MTVSFHTLSAKCLSAKCFLTKRRGAKENFFFLVHQDFVSFCHKTSGHVIVAQLTCPLNDVISVSFFVQVPCQ